MNIPVYELHDGESIDGFTKVVTGDIKYTTAGVMERIKRVTLRRVSSRYGYNLKALPVNYATLNREQVLQALSKARYNVEYVSIDGDKMMQLHDIHPATRFN